MRIVLRALLAAVIALLAGGPVLGAITPNDPFYPSQWALTQTRTNEAWDTTRGSSSVVIAVIDRGVYLGHPELAGRMVPGWNFVEDNATPLEDSASSGHGSATGGIIGVATNNGAEGATYCWDCKLMPIRAWGSTSNSIADIAAGYRWAADHGADIISISYCAGASTTLQAAVQYAASKGVLLVAGTTGSCYPAAYPEVIEVIGSNQDGSHAQTPTPRSVIAVPNCNRTTNRDGYGTHVFCAPSSTGPALAGILGLGEALYPNATRSQVVAALRSSATPVAGSTVGRVDVPRYLAALAGAPTTSTPSPTATATAKPTFCDRHPSHRRCN